MVKVLTRWLVKPTFPSEIDGVRVIYEDDEVPEDGAVVYVYTTMRDVLDGEEIVGSATHFVVAAYRDGHELGLKVLRAESYYSRGALPFVKRRIIAAIYRMANLAR